ncbi:MAG: hypothetical protein ACRECH_07825 [Nitrososphaerales archaeon]
MDSESNIPKGYRVESREALILNTLGEKLMAERREKGFTLVAVPERDSRGWVLRILPHKRMYEKQEEWLAQNENKKVRIAREDIRHPRA